MGKLGNTLAMLRILETGKKYTVKELAKMIEVSPRMIKTYKYELEKAGIFIDSINGVYGGYVYNKKNNYNVSFSIKDVNILERLIVNISLEEKEKLEPLLEKIKTIVIYSESEKNLKQSASEVKRKYNIVSKAIKEQTSLLIEYKNKVKEFIPHNISFYKDFIYITGYSTSDDELRSYNINEINFK